MQIFHDLGFSSCSEIDGRRVGQLLEEHLNFLMELEELTLASKFGERVLTK